MVEDGLGKPERHRSPDPSIREALTVQYENSDWIFIWYEPNPSQKGSNPDFAAYRDHELLLAIECKNQDPKLYHPSLQWVLNRVISRFQFHDAQTKLLYIPYLVPLPKDREKVYQALKDHGIKVIQLGRQIQLRDRYGYQYVKRDLAPHIEEALGKGKKRHMSMALYDIYANIQQYALPHCLYTIATS